MDSSSTYRARLREWHENTGCDYTSLDALAASDLGLKPCPPAFPPGTEDHEVLLADRCSPDTSHRKLRLPLLLPLLPFLLVAIVWVAIALAAIIYALLLIEQMLEVLDPTPPDQFRDRNQPVSRSLFADETSANRLTRSGSFCCGWLWCTSDTLAPEKPLPLSQRVRRFLRAPRRRLQLLLAESSTATLLEAPWLLLALWRGTPLRRARDRARDRGRLPQRRRVSHDPSRAYFFLLARDELVWHATEAASSRGAMPAGSIRLDSIVEARRSPPCVSPVSPLCLPYISYRRSAPAPPCVSPVSPLCLPCISSASTPSSRRARPLWLPLPRPPAHPPSPPSPARRHPPTPPLRRRAGRCSWSRRARRRGAMARRACRRSTASRCSCAPPPRGRDLGRGGRSRSAGGGARPPC